MHRILLSVAMLAGLGAAVTLHGYIYSTSIIQKYIDRCGAHPTLDQAIASDMRHNGWVLDWFEEEIKAQNREDVPYTWYVVHKVRPEFKPALDQAPRPDAYCGGSFYENTRQGWVGMPEHLLNATGYLDFWMSVFRLYGTFEV